MKRAIFFKIALPLFLSLQQTFANADNVENETAVEPGLTRIYFVNARDENFQHIDYLKVYATLDDWKDHVRQGMQGLVEERFGATSYTYGYVQPGKCYVLYSKVEGSDPGLKLDDWNDTMEQAEASAKRKREAGYTIEEIGCNDGQGRSTLISDRPLKCPGLKETFTYSTIPGTSHYFKISSSTGFNGNINLSREANAVFEAETRMVDYEANNAAALGKGAKSVEHENMEAQFEAAKQVYYGKLWDFTMEMCDPDKSDPTWEQQTRQVVRKLVEWNRGCSYDLDLRDPKHCEFRRTREKTSTWGIRG